jgi:hypothetical protein
MWKTSSIIAIANRINEVEILEETAQFYTFKYVSLEDFDDKPIRRKKCGDFHETFEAAKKYNIARLERHIVNIERDLGEAQRRLEETKLMEPKQ